MVKWAAMRRLVDTAALAAPSTPGYRDFRVDRDSGHGDILVKMN